MEHPPLSSMFHGARILVAPLDWGLGHATRCIPVLHRLIEHGAEPVIGADKGPLALLRDEFPALDHVQLPGIPIRYGAGRTQLWSMTRQFPAMVRSVQAERAHFDRIRTRLGLAAVISDQRFGIRSADLPSVIITHQVFPFTPLAQAALRKVNRSRLMRFDRCWVVDHAHAPGLAGDLAHGSALPTNARYIGALSRMHHAVQEEGASYAVVAVISGPEPQRSMLDDLLTAQLRDLPGKHLLVQGLPGEPRTEVIGNLTKVAHLNATALNARLMGAKAIITRTGYTTLMDLEALGRSAILIPTPGQPEQEYLGRLHGTGGRHVVRDQFGFDLRSALEALDQLPGPRPVHDTGPLDAALADLASLLR